MDNTLVERRDLGLVISRFQPYTNRHKALVDLALKHVPTVYCVVCGEGKPRTRRDPFTASERIDMITSNHLPDGPRVQAVSVPDCADDHTWASYIISRTVPGMPVDNRGHTLGGRLALFGYRGDASLFPNAFIAPYNVIGCVTQEEILRQYFLHRFSFESYVENDVPTSTLARMQEFHNGPIYLDLLKHASDVQ